MSLSCQSPRFSEVRVGPAPAEEECAPFRQEKASRGPSGKARGYTAPRRVAPQRLWNSEDEGRGGVRVFASLFQPGRRTLKSKILSSSVLKVKILLFTEFLF